MKSLMAAALLLALASPALAFPAPPETCTGRVEVDAFVNELAGGRIAYVGDCMFLPPLPKRILRSCPKGSYCRVEGVTYNEGEVAPEINAFTSAIRMPAPKGEWFLIFDAETCSRFGCERDIQDFGLRPEHEDVVDTETYATKEQCLVMGRKLEKLPRSSDKHLFENPLYRRAIAPYEIASLGWGGLTGKVTFRCVWSREH